MERQKKVLKCSRCGKGNPPILIENLCLNCFLETKVEYQRNISLPVCQFCGKVRVFGSWKNVTEEKITEHVLNEIDKDARRIFGRYGVSVFSQVNNKGEIIVVLSSEYGLDEWKPNVTVSMKYSICPECSRKITGHHEALIQFRSHRGVLSERERREIKKELEKLPVELRSSLIEIKDVREGIDVKVYEHSSARSIANIITQKLPSEIKETFKLISARGGKKKTKLTISVRLYEKVTDKIMEYDEKPVIVNFDGRGKAFILDLKTGKKTTMPHREALNKLRPYRGSVEEIEIIGVTSREVHVIRLSGEYSFEKISLEHVYGEPHKGKKGYLLEIDNTYYLVVE